VTVNARPIRRRCNARKAIAPRTKHGTVNANQKKLSAPHANAPNSLRHTNSNTLPGNSAIAKTATVIPGIPAHRWRRFIPFAAMNAAQVAMVMTGIQR